MFWFLIQVLSEWIRLTGIWKDDEEASQRTKTITFYTKPYWGWRKAEPIKILRNYLVFQQIHFPHGKRIKIKAFRLSRKGGLQRKGRKLRSNKQRYDQVNKAVLKWFKMLRSENVHTNGVLIKELTFENFQTSDGWLDKWKKMLGLTFLFQIILLYNYRN